MPDQIFTWNFATAVIFCLVVICITIESVARKKKCTCKKNKAE